MKLDLLFLPSEVTDSQLENKLVIVIDVLRASSTIATALHNGAKDIIPAESQESATRLMQDIGRKYVLLCGERRGVKIEGFDLGNSPFEYTDSQIRDKTLIFSSTNGSRAIVKAASASQVIIGCFLNLNFVLDYACQTQFEEVALLCSGKEERFSLEDSVCAGMMVSQLKEKTKDHIELSDSAWAGFHIYNQYNRDILKMLTLSSHGKYLIGLGFHEDLAFCSQVDSLPIVPVLETGHIVKKTV